MLLRGGADTGTKDLSGLTALLVAVDRGDVDLVVLLLEYIKPTRSRWTERAGQHCCLRSGQATRELPRLCWTLAMMKKRGNRV